MTKVEKKSGLVKTFAIIFIFMALMLGLMLNKVLNPPPLSTAQFKERGIFLFEPARKIKEFQLQSHLGQPFTKASLTGKWGMMFFGFTHCPDVCPTTMAMLNKTMAEIQDPDVAASTQVMLMTVDPARDTAEKLNAYVPYFNKDFIGITGDFLKILSVSGNLNAPFRKIITGETYTMDHSAYIFLINPRGDLQGFLKPPFDAKSLAINYLAIRKKFANDF